MSGLHSKSVSVSADNSRRHSLEQGEDGSIQGDEQDGLLPSSRSVPSSPRFKGASLSRLLAPARNLSYRISSPRRSVLGDDLYGPSKKQYDDQEFENEMSLTGGNVKVHYSSYTTIDWVHDSIKESSRLRRLARIKGIRGLILTSWDRFQSWLIVTIVGVLVALIAGGIVMSEAVLFDLKEGYCEKDWRLAKRFCCPFAQGPDYPDYFTTSSSNATDFSSQTWSYASSFKAGNSDPTKGLLTGLGNHFLAGWAGPVAGSPAWKKVAKSSSFVSLASSTEFKVQNEECPGWVTWGEKLTSDGKDSWLADYGMYILVAIFWASIASLLTIYLTSSELYVSQKNSPPLAAALSNPKSSSSSDDKKDSNPSNGEQVSNVESSSSTSTSATATSSTSGLPFTTPDERSPLLPKSKSSDPLPSKVLSRLAQEQISSQALPPRKVLYFGSGSGIPEVKCILSGFVIHGYLGFWTLFTKAVGLTFSVASGLSLGKEGPFVQIASCVGNIVCRVFPAFENNEAKRREILSCACAAGVAVAFGAPVGGVLFSLEEVSYFFPSSVMFRSFFCAMVAAATLRAIDPFGTGKIVLFQVTYDKDWHFREIPFFLLIGIFGGLYGAYFTKLNMLWSKNVRSKTWMARKPILEVIMITSLTVFVSFFNEYTRMGGTELIADLFAECHEHESLDGLCISSPSQIRPLITAIAWTCLAKGLLTIVTFGIKLPAGIFIPTLAVGACFGRIVGLLVQYVQWTQPDLAFFDWCSSSDTSCIVPGVYAMIGAAATLSGTTRTTVSLAVIMFELTGTLTYSVPVMLALLVAKTIADALEHKGIYDLVIEFSGLPFLDNKIDYTWDGVSVQDAMDTGIELIYAEHENTIQNLRSKLERLALGNGYTDGGFPIVVKTESSSSRNVGVKVIGYVAAAELEHALIKIMVKDPELDPSTAVATFKNIPYLLNQSGSLAGSVDGLENIRESVILGQLPLDLSIYVDKAPITVQTHSPLELIHRYFTSLGVKTLIVTDEKGLYKGVIFKKTYLAFLESLDKKDH